MDNDQKLFTVDFEIFARVFANSIKRHISDVKSSRLRQDLPISIKDRVILPFCEGFIFTKNFQIYSTQTFILVKEPEDRTGD